MPEDAGYWRSYRVIRGDRQTKDRKSRLTVAQKRAVAEWKARTKPGRDYSISEVFSPRDAATMRLRSTMHQLAARGMLRQGIPGGDPLREVV